MADRDRKKEDAQAPVDDPWAGWGDGLPENTVTISRRETTRGAGWQDEGESPIEKTQVAARHKAPAASTRHPVDDDRTPQQPLQRTQLGSVAAPAASSQGFRPREGGVLPEGQHRTDSERPWQGQPQAGPATSQASSSDSLAGSLANIVVWVKTGWQMWLQHAVPLMLAQALVAVLLVCSLGLLCGPVLAGYFRYGQALLTGRRLPLKAIWEPMYPWQKPLVGLGALLIASLWSLGFISAVLSAILGALPLLGWLLGLLVGLLTLALSLVLAGTSSLVIFWVQERRMTLRAGIELLRRLAKSEREQLALIGFAIGALPALGAAVFGLGFLVGGPLGMLVGVQAYRELSGTGAPVSSSSEGSSRGLIP